MTAGMPVQLNTQSPQTLLFASNSSVGAVVATTPLSDCVDLNKLVGEVARVLQPGGVFVFMQRLTNGGAVQGLVGDASDAIGMLFACVSVHRPGMGVCCACNACAHVHVSMHSPPYACACFHTLLSDAVALERALEQHEYAFDHIDIDMSLQGVDSHVIGVAVRSVKAVPSAGRRMDDEPEEDGAVQQLRRQKQQQSAAPKKKGFGGKR